MLSKLYKKYKNRQRKVKCEKGYATFHIDELSIFKFSGWVFKNSSTSEESCFVSFKLNNATICETPASIFREDLETSGIGNGACGFSVEPNWQVLEEGENVVVMYVNDVPVHSFRLTVTNKQLMVAMTSQIHRQIELAKTEIIESISSK
ncbi:hypothetical protein [Alteromonas australica]|uniref:hypothetical protein n=1 Tax=Alteromonas australica TaxID=589873 RepID=UPI000C89E4E8|nr:hypothetical protein [Alteromonas australica]MAC45239.1 hypothetical protein [Oceanospirillum sp.]